MRVTKTKIKKLREFLSDRAYAEIKSERGKIIIEGPSRDYIECLSLKDGFMTLQYNLCVNKSEYKNNRIIFS